MIKGKENIKQIHDILYNNEFYCCNLRLEYIPHITVGKVETVEKLNRAYKI